MRVPVSAPNLLLALLFASLPLCAGAQSPLQRQIAGIAAAAQGTVGVACALPGTPLDCDLHAHEHAPMQSMYKLPLGMTALHLAAEGKLLPGQRPGEPLAETLARPVRFLPSDRIPGTFSPLADRYPAAGVELPLREVLTLAVGQSDNDAEEILVRLVGGPQAVERYLHSIGIAAVEVRWSERDLDRKHALQYGDWIEPVAAVQLLELLAHRSPLGPAATAFLLQTMTRSMTGPDRLRAGLPAGTPLAHKTGTSGTENGVAAATNDIGLITLPGGRQVALAVFVIDSRADDATRARVIAEIGRAVYEEALVRQ